MSVLYHTTNYIHGFHINDEQAFQLRVLIYWANSAHDTMVNAQFQREGIMAVAFGRQGLFVWMKLLPKICFLTSLTICKLPWRFSDRRNAHYCIHKLFLPYIIFVASMASLTTNRLSVVLQRRHQCRQRQPISPLSLNHQAIPQPITIFYFSHQPSNFFIYVEYTMLLFLLLNLIKHSQIISTNTPYLSTL